MLNKILRIPVLCYHNISANGEKNRFPEDKDWMIEVEKFEKQMKLLHKLKYKTLTLEEFYNWKKGKLKLPLRSVLITFDDGYLSNYTYAFPILKKYGLKATVFIIGAYINDKDEENWKETYKKIIHKNDIEKICKEYPNIEFASHSYDLHHRGAVENKTYEELLKDCNMYKEQVLDTKFFAYPYGEYNDKIIQALKDSNYKMAFIFTNQRKAAKKDDDYLVPRLDVSSGVDNWKVIIKMLTPFLF